MESTGGIVSKLSCSTNGVGRFFVPPALGRVGRSLQRKTKGAAPSAGAAPKPLARAHDAGHGARERAGVVHEFRHTQEAGRGRSRGSHRPQPEADAELVSLGGARRRRDHRHRHLHPHRRGGGPRGTWRDPVLRHRRRDLRLRGALLRRDGQPEPAGRQRLRLFLHDARRADRLGGRLEPDPRIHPGLQRGLGGLGGLRRGPDPPGALADPRRRAGLGRGRAASSTCRPFSSPCWSPACCWSERARARRSISSW